MLDESVKSTYDYDLFKFTSWNRAIDEKNLTRIDKKVKEEGWRKIPILVDQKGNVYDGQHRLVYAKEHNLPVYYTVIKGLQKEDCQIINTTQKKWETKDYINFYAKQKNESYIKLKYLCSSYSFLTPIMIVALIKGTAYGGFQQKTVREGNFELSDKEYKQAIKKLDFMQRIEPYIRYIKGKSSQLYNAIGFCYEYEGVDNERLVNCIKTRIKTITPPANLEWALKEIETIYNWHNRGDYVYVFTEYKKQVASPKSRINRKNEYRKMGE